MADLKIILTVVDKDTGKVQTLRRSLADLAAEAGRTDQKVGGLAGGIGNLVSGLGGLARPLVAGYIGFQGVKAAVGGITETIGAASAMNETINKSAVVFGDSAKMIERFGDTSASAIGQAKEQAIAAAATFGNLFEATGMGATQAARLSRELVILGSDLASFNNTDPAEALEALRSGMVGMVEPLRRYGVNLIETNVAAKAAAMGFREVNGTFSDNDKMMARYALILDQTKNAQGDFARTSTGLANATRIMQASFKDIQAEIGAAFLPSIADLTVKIGKGLPGAFNALKPEVQRLGDMLGALGRAADDAGTSLDNVGGASVRAAREMAAATGHARTYKEELADLQRVADGAAQSDWDRAVKLHAQQLLLYQNPDPIQKAALDKLEKTKAEAESLKTFMDSLKSRKDFGAEGNRETSTQLAELAKAEKAYQDAIMARAEASDKVAAANAASARGEFTTEAGRQAYLQNMIDKAAEDAAALKKAASEAEAAAKKALAEGIAAAAKEASKAVRDLSSAFSDLSRTPMLEEKPFTDKAIALGDQLAAIDLQMAQLKAQRGTGAQQRALLRTRKKLEDELNLSTLTERVQIEPLKRTLAETLNPTPAPRSFWDLITNIPRLRGGLTGAEAAQEAENSGLATAIARDTLAGGGTQITNQVTVTVAGGQVQVTGNETALGKTIGDAINAALAAFMTAGATTMPGASPALPGAR